MLRAHSSVAGGGTLCTLFARCISHWQEDLSTGAFAAYAGPPAVRSWTS